LFGTALVPFVYISVNYWRTIHPTTNVLFTLQPEMANPFRSAVVSFLLFFTALLIVRIRLEASRAVLEEAYASLED